MAEPLKATVLTLCGVPDSASSGSNWSAAVPAWWVVPVLAFLILRPATHLQAQESDPPVAPDSSAIADTSGVVQPDSGALAAVAPPATQEAGADSGGVSAPVSPMGAFFRSLILPGWGQVSVDQPGRGAFYFAMEAGSLWMLFKTSAKLDAARNGNPVDTALVAKREDQLEDWITLSVFWALFAGVDAWVSAQLWDFTPEVVPPPDGSPGAAFRYSVPVGP
jgi:hypothetical protein